VVLRLIDLSGGGPSMRRKYREEQRSKPRVNAHMEIDLARSEWRSEPEWRLLLRRPSS
jgi:hypothetical protein